MGDMKTPDFDDLLAAFDIPDATSLDAKEAIQESHDEPEGHLKHTGMCMDDSVSVAHSMTPADVPAVSVIVKNTSRQESFEYGVEKEGPHMEHLLQNGFKNFSNLETHGGPCYPRLNSTPMNGDSSQGFFGKDAMPFKMERILSLSKSFPQFSPISSPESEDLRSNGIDDRPKQEEEPYFPVESLFSSADMSRSDNHAKQQAYKMINKSYERNLCIETVNISSRASSTGTEDRSECFRGDQRENKVFSNDLVPSVDDNHSNPTINTPPTSETNSSATCPSVNKPSKLSSCLDALVSLNPRKDPSEQSNSRELPMPVKETVRASPKVPISPRSPRSPLEVVKRFVKPPDSPMSVCSDSSGKASPALAAGSPLAIPRVRIKTIKMSSGQIKRTVTSILPDSEPEDLQSPFESSPSQSSFEEAFSKSMPMYRTQDIISEVILGNEKRDVSRGPQRSITSKAKAVSTLKKTPSQKVSGSFKRTQKGSKQRKASSSQTGSPSTNYLPKALHLANLNLVPHSVAASVTARSTSHKQSPSQLSSSMVCSSVPLVHQVKKTTPKSRTIMPNTAAGTLSRLLNYSNPVPTYVPDLNPPPDSNIKLPVRGYCCLECGDSFGLEKSLTYHYGRKSVHIEVACTHCSKTLVFFNKCALLAHAREHKNKGMVMQCTQLFMKPIAADQMFVPAKPERPVPRKAHVGGSVQSIRIPSVPVMPLYPDKAIRHGMKCLECDKPVSDNMALAGHYQRTTGETEGLICKICSMLLPNKCSYRAHQRIHAHKSPYCCPECGAVSRSVDIQKHVKENCLHYARKVGYACLHCDVLYVSLSLLKSHIEEKHCRVFYKCSVCPVAFKTTDGCLIHIKNKHSGTELSPQMIYKCSCETVFKKKQLLFQHFHQRACLFKCPDCTSFFTQKQVLVQHFKETHGGVFRSEEEKSSKPTELSSLSQHAKPAYSQPKVPKPVNGTGKGDRDGAATHRPGGSVGLKNAGWTCGECLLWLPDRETYITHMKTSHSRLMKRHPCRQCERSFNSSLSLRRHIRHDHDGKKKVYACWYCTDERVTFTKHFMLKNHLSLMHGIKNPDFSMMAKVAPQESSKPVSQGSKRTAEEARTEGKDGVSPEITFAKRPKSLFRCSKCGYTTEDRALFQQHIPQHKTDDDTPQCQRCGLCFTSQLALNRHLFIVHKVKEQESPELEEEKKIGEQRDLEDVCAKDESGPPVEKISPAVLEEPASLPAEPCSVTADSDCRDYSTTQTPETNRDSVEKTNSEQWE